MPKPGVPNNPEGINNFDHFAPEPAYGEATRQATLAGAAPLAGAPLSVGPINAPRRSQRRAATPRGASVSAPTSGPVAALPAPVSTAAQVWAEIASARGAERWPVLAEQALAARTLASAEFNPVHTLTHAATATYHAAGRVVHAIDRGAGGNGYPASDRRSNDVYYHQWIKAGAPEPPPDPVILADMIRERSRR